MGVFDGIDPEREAAIRQALTKELRHRVADELRETIRRQIEDEVRSETERAVHRAIAERAPTHAEREGFRAFVREVRLDAYAQATLASNVADEADAALRRSRSIGTPLAVIAGVTLPLTVLALSQALGGWSSPTFIAAALTVALALLAGVAIRIKRDAELARRAREHHRVASELLILAERAKAFHMVHADRITSSEELHELLEDLRCDKEKQDRTFDPSLHALEEAREEARLRIEADKPLGVRVESEALDEEVEEAGEQRVPARRRTKARS